jgi:hypothetical protein
MADEETRIRITAQDNTAQAARSAAENIRRIGEATRAAMGSAKTASDRYMRAVEAAARRERDARRQQAQLAR